MRKPEYLSPSAINLFYSDLETYYIRYLTEKRSPREPQTQPMSVGSAFDAYIKSHLHYAVYGNYGEGDKFRRESLFESQVEPQNRDWAKPAGQYLFEEYTRLGALSDLLLELRSAIGNPRFEIEIASTVDADLPCDVKLLGKPDLYFMNKEATNVEFDFKVNGYCSKASPKPGYVQLRGGKSEGPHKNAVVTPYQGMKINSATTLERVNEEWAVQLSIYSWITGQKVGSQFIAAIDQLACNSDKGFWPEVRIAAHRLLVSREFQLELYQKIVHMWDIICSGHIFRNLSREDSDLKCQSLDIKSEVLGSDDADTELFRQMARKG